MSDTTVLPINHLLRGELQLVEVLVATGVCSSKGDATRNFKQNGIRVNDERSPDRLLFLGDLRQRPDGTAVIMLRRGQHTFHWLEFTDFERAGAYATDPPWFHKSGAPGGWSNGWATRKWGVWPGAIDGPWVYGTRFETSVPS